MNFSKLLIKPTKYRRLDYPNLNLTLGLQSKRRTVQSLLQGYSWAFEQTNSIIVPVSKEQDLLLNITVINSFSQKLSTWATAKSNISTRIDFLLLTSVTFLRAITMCSAFTPDCGHDKSTIILTGDVYWPNTKCSGKLCLQKKTFQSLGRSDYQCLHCASVCQVRNIPFEEQTKSFSCHLVKAFTILKKIQSQFKMLLEMSIVLASINLIERNVNILTVM